MTSSFNHTAQRSITEAMNKSSLFTHTSFSDVSDDMLDRLTYRLRDFTPPKVASTYTNFLDVHYWDLDQQPTLVWDALVAEVKTLAYNQITQPARKKQDAHKMCQEILTTLKAI